MVFSQQCYSVLIVSDSARFNQVISDLLPASAFAPVRIVPSISAAKRAALERVYDLVILNAPLPDDFGTAFAVAQSGNRQTVVLILVRSALQEQLHNQVIDQGVFTLSKPTTPQALETALRWMTAARERLRRIEETTKTVDQKMQEIRLLNRAKLLLMQQRGMSEDEAHHYLEKQAMERCISKRTVVEELLEALDASGPGKPGRQAHEKP